MGGNRRVLVIEDDGAPEVLLPETASGASPPALRGRPLVLAIADVLLAGIDGTVAAHRLGGRTRVELAFPRGH